ncbi:MAG: hydroxymethylglutaryl-CoA synthase family protein [Deltaproteobacteria bacterium]|nr:hydroxymethylglutaryl-CoA synthase family protein [Deltaproteobacteria bacterium]
MVGICSYGGYVPRYRLNRMKIFDAMGWMNASTIGNAKGERSVANFDEDSITMAVAAGIDCMKGISRSRVQSVFFASTSMPYKERLNAGIVAGALALDEHIRAADFCGGLKAGTTALLSALEGAESGRITDIIVCSSDCRLGKPGSPQEMIFGDAGAALLIGDEEVIAEYKGGYSTTYDFVDHYRGASAKYDRQWEDRWIRDMGYDFLIPEAINGLLEKYQLKITDFSKVIYPCHYGAERRKLNKILSISPEMEQDDFLSQIGEAGTAQPLVMLVNAMEKAKPGEKIMVVGLGSGCDALYFEVTDNIDNESVDRGISGYLDRRAELDRYEKYSVWRGILPGDLGTRSEVDLWTRWSVNWRMRKALLGLWGSKCMKCGTAQYPPQNVCVKPECGAVNQMEEILFSDKKGKIISFTADNLSASYDPPAIYGSVEFDIGGRFMFDFTDCDLDSLSVGKTVFFSFRKKYHDEKRDISGYFWKAVPVKEVV